VVVSFSIWYSFGIIISPPTIFCVNPLSISLISNSNTYWSLWSNLILPELNISITPKAGDYYVFPPMVRHGFDKHKNDVTRYSLVCNFDSEKHFLINKKLEIIEGNKKYEK